ncbi:Fumarate reductase subunit C [invertebrate metagenome]|uniref:Fumarate reductase subunit C n=1 Tax=invertebrate metagenome TaxID=1711999 RepID=A0A2H9T722_9ZZZZ
MSRHPYVRPMKRTWFMNNPYYKRYMIRESMCVFTGAYAINLLIGLIQLASGAEAWQGWLHFQHNPLMILFSVIAFGLTVYHAITFFSMTPRVMPQQVRTRVPDKTISTVHFAALIVVSVIIIAATYWGVGA